LELFAASLSTDDRVALEVTGSAWEIARIIEPHVARVVVVSPSDTGVNSRPDGCECGRKIKVRRKRDRLGSGAEAQPTVSGSAIASRHERQRRSRRRSSASRRGGTSRRPR
jgi:hypothetical protein